MENKNLNLKDFALMCDLSEKVSRFGILADFLKRAIMDYYTYKSSKQNMPLEELEIFKQKYRILLAYFEEIEEIQQK